MDISGKTALITGASRGLGRAVAEALGAAGAQVIAVARTVGGLEEADDAIRAAGGAGAVLVPLDITDDPGLARLGAAINDRWGHLDLWVHTAINATMLAPPEHIEPKEFDRALAVNVTALQRLIRVVDPLLRQSPAGRAVFIDDGTRPTPNNAAYLASKQAQKTLTQAWDSGLAGASNVRVLTALAPPMPTALRARWHPGEDQSALTAPTEVSRRLLAALSQGATGSLDLTAAG